MQNRLHCTRRLCLSQKYLKDLFELLGRNRDGYFVAIAQCEGIDSRKVIRIQQRVDENETVSLASLPELSEHRDFFGQVAMRIKKYNGAFSSPSSCLFPDKEFEIFALPTSRACGHVVVPRSVLSPDVESQKEQENQRKGS